MKVKTNYDLLVIGGGINGTAIALDAAGRGLSVLLCEKDDLASGTSSKSTKLIHGGLRYLEHFEFRLVRESLKERQRLMNKAPHLITPLHFILPYNKHMRPRWLIRCGLFLYDFLAGKQTLPRSKSIAFSNDPILGNPLKDTFNYGFTYSDCWVDDARLVILNAIAAREKGADVLTRTAFQSSKRDQNEWHVKLFDEKEKKTIDINAQCIVNAAGPWVEQLLKNQLKTPSTFQLQLVKGSHLIVPKFYEGEHAYLLQHNDERIIFVIPYETHFALIGTTDLIYKDPLDEITITKEEVDYLIQIVNYYFNHQLKNEDIISHYSGVRPLIADASAKPSEITRDYCFDLDDEQGKAPLLSIFGGKLTTHRKLAEHAINQLMSFFSNLPKSWTNNEKLPGSEYDQTTAFNIFSEQYSWLSSDILKRYIRTYGTRLTLFLNQKTSTDDLGIHFGQGLYEEEVKYLIEHEWARTCDDILWRRTKLGLLFSIKEKEMLSSWIKDNHHF